jgi:predicted alpha/beta superfamily hydrolase
MAAAVEEYGGREVRVWLPDSYDAARPEPYPLLLLHDGQNVFDPASSTAPGGGAWRAGETVDRLVDAGTMPPTVVAGINHAGLRRIDEFTPTKGGRQAAGRADEYVLLVLNDILPGLARDYRIRTDAAGLTLGGSSLGGLVTLVIGAAAPGRFGRLIAMSPSVWWDRRVILRRLAAQPLAPGTRVWVDAGRHEGRRVLRDARALQAELAAHPGVIVRLFEDPDGEHSEESWGRRLADALAWLDGF